MIRTNLFQPTEAHRIVAQKGRYSLLEYEKDLSITPDAAVTAYFASQMNVRKRQVIAQLNNDGGVIVQAGAMQLMIGQLNAVTNIKGAGDFMKKLVGSKVSGETTISPNMKVPDFSSWNRRIAIFCSRILQTGMEIWSLRTGCFWRAMIRSA